MIYAWILLAVIYFIGIVLLINGWMGAAFEEEEDQDY
jgi:hypothetical protein